MKKRYIVCLLVLTFFIGAMSGVGWYAGAGEERVLVWINGKLLNSDPAPRIIDGRVFVPLRAVSDSLGASVGWDETANSAFIAGYNDPLTINIQGPESFKKDMRDCIDILREKDPEGYALLGKYVKTIVWGDYPSPMMDPLEMRMMIPKDHCQTDKYWWSATLVHEAQHGEQRYSVKRYTLEERETEAYNRDLQTLKRIGAPQKLIEQEQKLIDSKPWQN